MIIKNGPKTIKMWRNKDGRAEFNIEQKIVRHSPDGMEFGFSGSGPSDLALNILNLYLDEKTADRYYKQFKLDFISCMPKFGGEIPSIRILAFIKDQIFEMDCRRKKIKESLKAIKN